MLLEQGGSFNTGDGAFRYNLALMGGAPGPDILWIAFQVVWTLSAGTQIAAEFPDKGPLARLPP